MRLLIRVGRIAPTHLSDLIQLRGAFFSDLCLFLNLRNRSVNHSYKYLDVTIREADG